MASTRIYIANNSTLILPNSSLSQSFDPNLQTGVGAYLVDLNAPLFAVDTGNLFVSFQEFQGSPLDLGSIQVSGDIEISAAAQLEVIPEPAAMPLTALALACLAYAGMRRRRS
ncbi:hypothetical protein SBA3_3020017 [Candidatus Sulfopaludibacter sp. SbA3]|nr:hypothetical protein SBA3_3020017 [Candidatus Sulfopaludibacter sp. SbA3]